MLVNSLLSLIRSYFKIIYGYHLFLWLSARLAGGDKVAVQTEKPRDFL